jgi:8-oxo-dGTP pyrophosphatase MutT (NUDIX family)
LSSFPRDAATVVLVRDGAAGLEVFLLRRVPGLAVAPGMSVFPGGSVDPSDAEPVPWIGPPPASWTTVLGADESLVRSLVSAAVRETFEESGVLLADSPGTQADRVALERHEISLADVLLKNGLSVRADLLTPWAHWITPDSEPRRHDTRFFLAAMPVGQKTSDGAREAEIAEWVRPADALRQNVAGSRPLLPPTYVILRELAGFADVAAVFAAAADRAIEPIQPVRRAGEVILPGGERIALP